VKERGEDREEGGRRKEEATEEAEVKESELTHVSSLEHFQREPLITSSALIILKLG
jgi:hypothetical protein